MNQSGYAIQKMPKFAILGHPNEGKSSVVSTLTEDDQIRVSPMPGETTISCAYTVQLDGKNIIRFVDTPGFQVPRQTLEWFRRYRENPEKIITAFIDDHKNDPFVKFHINQGIILTIAWVALAIVGLLIGLIPFLGPLV
ncbi:MAG: hypothetical protein GY729_14725, partial [Desulfobacteraceae bacterium]|nr:hypothetical protein [Desulfobacteraceae bacterium]